MTKHKADFWIYMPIAVMFAIVMALLIVKVSQGNTHEEKPKIIATNPMGCTKWHVKDEDFWTCPADTLPIKNVKVTYCDALFKKYFCSTHTFQRFVED